jgi:hypothetical protein
VRAARVALGLAILVALLPARADEELPPRLQAALFRKIFLYETDLGRGPPDVLILAGRLSSGRAQEMVQAFSEAGVEASAAEPGGRLPTINQRTVIYAFPDVPKAELRRLATSARALTISGDPEMALSGRVSVALRRKADGHPEILVNLPVLQADGRELSASLLKLATVIRGPDALPRDPSP